MSGCLEMSDPIHQKPMSSVVYNEDLDLAGLPLSIFLPSQLWYKTAHVKHGGRCSLLSFFLDPLGVWLTTTGNCWRKTVTVSITETALPVQGWTITTWFVFLLNLYSLNLMWTYSKPFSVYAKLFVVLQLHNINIRAYCSCCDILCRDVPVWFWSRNWYFMIL